MSGIEYSFIVPHHNNPELLNRLIASIPLRDDVEIIVVDDNSDEAKKPVELRSDCRFLKLSSSDSMGAGKARNVGLDHANGRWLLFADCDDCYEEGFLNVLDNYVNSEIDILYYDVFYAWDPVQKKERWPQKYSVAIANYLKDRSSVYWQKMVKHVIQGPWNFMIRREYVLGINARFEEVPKGNDAYFHHYVAMNTNRFEIVENKIYYWLWNEGGITGKKRSKDAYLSEIPHNAKLLNMRAEAGAWNTIPPFYKGFGKVKSDCGIFFSVKWLCLNFFSEVPWFRVWPERKKMELRK